ncbi:LytR C-terminal domain-containing protein [Streptomyces sp. HNM0574]|nr:LytR C-terminal domain-containing protein [Streptomyces sp. HNM0574]
MGGKYRVKGDRYPRMRRPRGRRKTAFATVAVIATLSLLGWGSLQLLDAFTGGSSQASASGKKDSPPDCAAPGSAKDDKPAPDPAKSDVKYPAPKSITVNVLNATDRSGLAQRTSDELKKRGFKPGEVGNAPPALDKKVKGSALLVGAPGKDTTASLAVLGTQVAGGEKKYEDRKGSDVDLVIGDGFKKLAKKQDAEKALDALNNPEPSPKPSPSRCER